MKRTILSILGVSLITIASLAQTQPMNANFENWEELPFGTSTMEEPVGWNSSNQCTALLNVTPLTKSTDSNSGTFSARMESHDGPGSIVVNGVLTTAEMICGFNSGGQEGGSPHTDFIPDSIVGWYKYTPANSDSAYSQIMFLANNDQDTVSYTRINFTQTVTSWTRFSAPITPGSASPEKLSLFFSSSWGDGAQGEGEVGSVFLIDDVSFYYPQDVSVGDDLEANEWTVYPNPVADNVNVRVVGGTEANIEILDVTGKRMKYLRLSDNNTTIDLSAFIAGVYLYQIQSLDGQVLRTGKLLVNP